MFDVNRTFQKIFGTIVIKCFFGNIKLNAIDGKEPFDFLSDLFRKSGERNIRVSSFLFGDFLMKFGVRKIDREIKEEIQSFRKYTSATIEQIIQSLE